MFQVKVIDPSGVSEYFFTSRELVVASFALTYHALKGQLTYEQGPGREEHVFYTNESGARSHIGQITDLSIPGRILNCVEHF